MIAPKSSDESAPASAGLTLLLPFLTARLLHVDDLGLVLELGTGFLRPVRRVERVVDDRE